MQLQILLVVCHRFVIMRTSNDSHCWRNCLSPSNHSIKQFNISKSLFFITFHFNYILFFSKTVNISVTSLSSRLSTAANSQHFLNVIFLILIRFSVIQIDVCSVKFVLLICLIQVNELNFWLS